MKSQPRRSFLKPLGAVARVERDLEVPNAGTANLPARIWRHKVKQTLDVVRRKYNITGRFTQADFYRICREENIWLMNNEESRSLLNFKKLYGVCAGDKSGHYCIYLRSFFNRSRKLCMFTAGHELGHFFLGHIGANPKANLGLLVNEQFEKEANYFARLFLKTEVENE